MILPWLSEDERISFPIPDDEDGALEGGNLSPGMLLSAYEQGYFPWYGPDSPIIWWSPDPRFVLFPEEVHIGSRLGRYLKNSGFRITCDRNFAEVISYCRELRLKQGTWINAELLEAYILLSNLGYAHSLEVWKEDELVGGLYGVRTGRVFSGESMFSRVPNASKAALIWLCQHAGEIGIDILDCQIKNPYLSSMGGIDIPRSTYLEILSRGQGRNPEHSWFVDPDSEFGFR